MESETSVWQHQFIHLISPPPPTHPPPHTHTHTQTICYSRLPSARNEDGLVALQFNKKYSQVIVEQEVIAKTIQALVNTPTVQVMVDGVRPLPDDW